MHIIKTKMVVVSCLIIQCSLNYADVSCHLFYGTVVPWNVNRWYFNEGVYGQVYLRNNELSKVSHVIFF